MKAWLGFIYLSLPQTSLHKSVIPAGLTVFSLMDNSPAIYYYVDYLHVTRDEPDKPRGELVVQITRIELSPKLYSSLLDFFISMKIIITILIS